MTMAEAKVKMAENERLYKDAVDRKDWEMMRKLMDEFRELNEILIWGNMPHIKKRS